MNFFFVIKISTLLNYYGILFWGEGGNEQKIVGKLKMFFYRCDYSLSNGFSVKYKLYSMTITIGKLYSIYPIRQTNSNFFKIF